jgi:hypothetical protein
MSRKIIIWVVICGLGSISTVILLSAISTEMKEKHGSFLRVFPPHLLSETGEDDLGVNSYYLAGATPNTIYLGNYSSSLHVLVCNKAGMDTGHAKLNIEGIHDQKFWAIRLEVDSPRFVVYDGAVPRIYHGSTDNWKAERFKYDAEYFLDIEPVGKKSFAVRSLSAQSGESVLGKISFEEPHYTFNPRILEKQLDGFFCTDGYLQYSSLSSKLVYLYRYRNEFMVMDSNVNLSYRGHTIDTNSVAKIKVGMMRSASARVLSAPPVVVNNKCAVSGNCLFVNSDLRAKNEPEGALKSRSVIDVYQLTDGRYIFSFYIYNLNGKEKLREFRVAGNTLVALFETHLQTFELERKYFDAFMGSKR